MHVALIHLGADIQSDIEEVQITNQMKLLALESKDKTPDEVKVPECLGKKIAINVSEL